MRELSKQDYQKILAAIRAQIKAKGKEDPDGTIAAAAMSEFMKEKT